MDLPEFGRSKRPAQQVGGRNLLRSRQQPTVSQAFPLHFETVHGNVITGGSGGTCQMQRKSRLSHRRTGGDDYQVARLPAARQAVQLVESRRQAGNSVLVRGDTCLYQFHSILHQLQHGTEMFGHPAFLFQLVEKGMRIRQRVGYVRCLVGSLCQQFMESQDRFTADILLLQDTGMVLQMCAGTLRVDVMLTSA